MPKLAIPLLVLAALIASLPRADAQPPGMTSICYEFAEASWMRRDRPLGGIAPELQWTSILRVELSPAGSAATGYAFALYPADTTSVAGGRAVVLSIPSRPMGGARRINGDSLLISRSDGFTSDVLRLADHGDSLSGIWSQGTDVGPPFVTHSPVHARKVRCPGPG
jgi:hypothetical protein